MKTRWISLALILMMALTALCPAAGAAGSGDMGPHAAGVPDGGEEESSNEGTCGQGLTWRLDEDGTLTVSGTGPMEDYGSDDRPEGFVSRPRPWNGASVRRVVLEEGVTTVGAAAFEDCGSLTEVSLPSTLQRIGTEAFAFCAGLAEPDLPAGLKTIGDRAFWVCDAFTSVRIPAGVTSLGENPFTKCHSLTEILAEEGCTGCSVIDGVLYSGDGRTLICYPLGRTAPSFTVPDGVTAVGGMAFFADEHLRTLTLSGTVTALGEYALTGMSALEELELPVSLTRIDHSAVGYCDSLSLIRYGGVRAQWDAISVAEENVQLDRVPKLFSDGETDPGLAGAGNCGKSDQVFVGNIPEDWSVFWAPSVTWTLDGLGTLRITGTGSLCETPQIIYGSRYIVASPWWELRGAVKRIVIDEGVTYIMFNNFRDFTGLESVTLPVSLKGVNKTAFYQCTALKDVYYRGSREQWRSVTVSAENGPLTSANIHYDSEGPEKLAVTAQPRDVTVARAGDKAAFTVTAQGDRLTYAWYYRDLGASKWTKSSVTGPKFNLIISQDREVYCQVADGNGNTVDSAVARGLVQDNTVLNLLPDATQVANPSDKVSFQVTGGTAPYTWYYRNAGAAKWSKSSVTGNKFSLVVSKDREAYCVSADGKESAVATASVAREDGSIQVTPQVGIAAKAGGRVTFTAAGGSGPYAWYYRNAGALTWTKSSVTTNKFPILVGKDREVFCACGGARSPVVTATVGK